MKEEKFVRLDFVINILLEYTILILYEIGPVFTQ